MKDSYGDKIETRSEVDGFVYLTIHDSTRDSVAEADLSPKKARKLAGKLLALADEAEGR